ncbi:hypothetical protein [Arenivirga flava]|uniref:hypothetical protein n=1 Tax=Arenivirga flava TaxID=1930060 RepID=UPI0024E0DFE7|nr:hypothetical protein [Arenivirga flava]
MLGIAATSAAFTDSALIELGTGVSGSAIGHPGRFDLAVLDDAGLPQDAAEDAQAVRLSVTGSPVLSQDDPVVMVVSILNRPGSPDGDVVIELYDPDPVAGDPFGSLRFDLYLAGSTVPAIAGASADEVNRAGIVLEGLASGETRTVRLEATIEQPPAVPGSGTRIGLRGVGETR